MRPEAASRGEASAWRGSGERPRELPGATRACGQQKGRLDDQWSASWNVDIPMQSCHLNTSCARNRQSFQGSSAVSRQVQAPGDLFKQKAGARGAPCAQRRTSLPEESQFFSEAQQWPLQVLFPQERDAHPCPSAHLQWDSPATAFHPFCTSSWLPEKLPPSSKQNSIPTQTFDFKASLQALTWDLIFVREECLDFKAAAG
ncbi:uncharacterized protein M8220_008136 isoform 1-T2 [Acridotheres tristis]